MGLTPYRLPRDALDFQQRNLDTINQIYNLSTYPNNKAFLEGGEAAVPAGIFSEDVIGRITPVGSFHGSKSTSSLSHAVSSIQSRS